MKAYVTIAVFIALIVGIIALISFSESENSRKKAHCEERGGTWFYHEQRCLAIKTIPVE